MPVSEKARDRMPARCPECGGPMAVARPDTHLEDTPFGEETEERDFAAEEVDPEESRAVKAGRLVCVDCGAVIETPAP